MIICGTGHRPGKLWGYNLNHPMYQRVKAALKNYFKEQYKKTNDLTIISGMALGFDTIFAQVALELKAEGVPIKLVCAIPCLNHTSKWFKESVVEWQRIVDLADEVVYVTNAEYTNACMQLRNEYMVNNSDVVIALFDGTPGGTANCVKYAEKIGKKIERMNPKDKRWNQ